MQSKNNKLCKIHNFIKILNERSVKGKIRTEYICTFCIKDKRKKYRENNKEKILISAKIYRDKNRDKINLSRRGKYKETAKAYRIANKKEIINQKNIYKKNKRNTDLQFKIRENISSSIRSAIKNSGLKKQFNSFLNYVDWDIIQLKDHLEKQFEPWMNWQNWGTYKAEEWDDNNQITWKWQIDHIIPQSDMIYTDMADENFKKCWSLSNLRPYSAKQNAIDGGSKIRHENTNKTISW
jgi:hypothetical protein